MKKALLLITLTLFSIMSFGQTFADNGINYEVSSAVAPLTVKVSYNWEYSGQGQIINTYSGFANIPSTVVYNSDNYTVTEIGQDAFNYCTGLTGVNIPNTITSIGQRAFLQSGITSVTIPSSVNSIEFETFRDCSDLTTVTILNGTTVINEKAFAFCNNLTSVTLPNSLTTIDIAAFAGCISLTSIVIPNSVTNLNNEVFNSCNNLTSVTLSNTITSISQGLFTNCTSLSSISIPNTVTSIGVSAFQNCSSLTTIVIPNGVATIGTQAFNDCSSLTSINIPNSISTIPNNTFNGCSSLASISLPSSITSIGDFAFYGCTSLTSFSINKVTPIVINNNVFTNVPLATATLYVPAGAEAGYDATAVWTDFNTISAIVTVGPQFIRFDDSTDIASIPDNTALDLTNAITLECFVRIDVAQDYHPLIFKSNANFWSDGWGLTIDDNRIHFFPFTWFSNSLRSLTDLTGNTWYHIAATYDGTTAKIYINGVLDASASITGGNLINTANPVIIGSDGGSTYVSKTSVDLVKIWSVVKTESEILADMANCIPANTPNLVAQYLFQETATSTTLVDSSGNNLNGTFTGFEALDWQTGNECGTTYLSNESFENTTKLSIYPNPSNSIFNINIDSNANLEVYDVIGKQIMSKKIDLGVSQLDMSNYNAGIYLLKVTNENNQTKTFKIVKQ